VYRRWKCPCWETQGKSTPTRTVVVCRGGLLWTGSVNLLQKERGCVAGLIRKKCSVEDAEYSRARVGSGLYRFVMYTHFVVVIMESIFVQCREVGKRRNDSRSGFRRRHCSAVSRDCGLSFGHNERNLGAYWIYIIVNCGVCGGFSPYQCSKRCNQEEDLDEVRPFVRNRVFHRTRSILFMAE
jgi:hypothetical protein